MELELIGKHCSELSVYYNELFCEQKCVVIPKRSRDFDVYDVDNYVCKLQ